MYCFSDFWNKSLLFLLSKVSAKLQTQQAEEELGKESVSLPLSLGFPVLSTNLLEKPSKCGKSFGTKSPFPGFPMAKWPVCRFILSQNLCSCCWFYATHEKYVEIECRMSAREIQSPHFINLV